MYIQYIDANKLVKNIKFISDLVGKKKRFTSCLKHYTAFKEASMFRIVPQNLKSK